MGLGDPITASASEAEGLAVGSRVGVCVACVVALVTVWKDAGSAVGSVVGVLTVGIETTTAVVSVGVGVNDSGVCAAVADAVGVIVGTGA